MNRLADETSPYLLQHAANPVDWYPWGPEALAKARAEDKPILLSIGYAACHWCHVMAHESFEDERTATFMNEHFVSIKVDREERPDLDSIYMDAVQAMNGQGGWPLTAFLTPAGEPFYAGTYFPPEPAHGMPSFTQVLSGITEAWRDRRDEVSAQGARVIESIARPGFAAGSLDTLDASVSREALRKLRGTFDERWGGFGGAPKFPQPMTLEFCVRQALRGVPDALRMVTTSLDRMAAGGIYDHVGGGFARYSTDAAWHVPHFEKMLYDNAQLARLYVRAWQVTREARYSRVAGDTLEYLLREMRHPEGGFFSSQDADSEGVEGKFYTWTWDELVELAGPDVARLFGATPEGNWEGMNVLWRPTPFAGVAAEERLAEERLAEEFLKAGIHEEGARPRLFQARGRRVHPGTDDKVLTAWNALAVCAFAEAGRTFGPREYLDAAVTCAEFLLANLRRDDGRLLRSWRDGVAGGPGYCDDYALLAEACLTLYETTFELRWFEEARLLADDLLRLFHDDERGGFFTSGSDAEPLVVRPKDLYDNALPSGNSVAADVLQRLALLTGEAEYERAGISGLRLVREAMMQAPTGFGHALCALDLYLGPSREVAIVGDPTAAAVHAMADELHAKRFLPNAVLAVAAPGDEASRTAVALLRDRPVQDGKPTAYVCERFVCGLPVTDPDSLVSQLETGAIRA